MKVEATHKRSQTAPSHLHACVRAVVRAVVCACMRACVRVCVRAVVRAVVRACVRAVVRACVRMSPRQSRKRGEGSNPTSKDRDTRQSCELHALLQVTKLFKVAVRSLFCIMKFSKNRWAALQW